MKVGDVLAIVGAAGGLVGLAVLVGVPTPAVILFVLATSLAYLGSRWLQRRRPEFILDEITKVLIIHDNEGRSATLRREAVQRANQSGLTEVWCRNIACDGRVSDFRIDGKPVPRGWIAEDMNLMHVRKVLDSPTQKGDKVHWILSYDLADSFTRESEAVIHLVGTPTKQLKFIVQFEGERVAKEGMLWENYGDAAPRSLGAVSLEGRQLEANLSDPKVGAQYSLAWSW